MGIDLFGVRQVWRHLSGKPDARLKFTTPFLYRIVRHPLYVGWFFAFWTTPVMTATHLLFALVTTAYILVATQFEKRDLMATHPALGSDYVGGSGRVYTRRLFSRTATKKMLQKVGPQPLIEHRNSKPRRTGSEQGVAFSMN